MALGLNLDACDAKLAQADFHLKVLKRETKKFAEQSHLWSANALQIKKNPSTWTVDIVAQEVTTPIFSLMVGDAIHNMRCALDYVITALVDASNAPLAIQHQFPVFADRQAFYRAIGSLDNPKGPLVGLKHGVHLIEQVQPYHRKQEPRGDPLWHVYRFSNADKHRQLLPIVPMPRWPPNLRFESPDGDIAKVAFEDPPSGALPNAEVRGLSTVTPQRTLKAATVTFAPGHPGNHLKVHTQISVVLAFLALPFGKETGHALAPGILRETHNHVGMVVDLFKGL